MIKHRLVLGFLGCIEVGLVFMLSAGTVQAETVGTHVSGVIAADTVWTASSSPYVLDGDIEVAPGTRFSIEPGATVRGNGAIRAIQAAVSIDGARFGEGPRLSLVDSVSSVSSTTIFAADGDAIYVEGGQFTGRRLMLERNSGAGLHVRDSIRQTANAGIYDSVFKENGFAVINRSVVPVEAQNDWWGRPNGPISTGENSVDGRLFYSPWLTEEPGKVCCSSVLFIPGLEGTRLYSGADKLWEPLGNWDVRRLFMDEAGGSIYPVSVGEVIGKAYGLKGIYRRFVSFIESLAAGGMINEARAYGYDWRRPADQVADEGLENLVREMAAGSATGKVSIVAHSNGGLVAKSLVRRLDAQGESSLLDKVVSVGVPDAGTPEAILALLHGDRQKILGGLILSSETAKGLAQNMPSAYGLLPSSSYPYGSTSPVITGKVDISDHEGQTAFLRNKSNNFLLQAAGNLHGILDSFVWPRQVSRVAIAGWNVLTTSGIRYFDKVNCRIRLLNKVCNIAEAHAADVTSNGDGTVVFPSASFKTHRVASLDLAKVSADEGSHFDHSNILESNATQAILRNILTGEELSDLSVDGFILNQGPAPDQDHVRFSVDGDASLKVYDAGNEPVGLERDFHDGMSTSTYVYVPKTSGERYSVVVTGNSVGYTTLRAESIDDGAVTGSVTYESTLVLPGSSASTTIDASLVTTAPLTVDLDNDGDADDVSDTGGTGLPDNAASPEEATGPLATTTVETLKEVLCRPVN